ncbi:MAG: hypothetical protein O7H41_03160 [Planctomycetota bacterium]|nr:hypothetical protein [Planctomycetota bacterium]
MAAEDLPEDLQADQPDEDQEAGDDASLDEDILVVLPDEEGSESADSFFDEAESNLGGEEPAEIGTASEEAEAVPGLVESADELMAEEVEISGGESPPAVEAAPVPVTVLDLAPDGLAFVYPQVTEYLTQEFLFYIVNAAAVEQLPGEELTLLTELDNDVRSHGGQIVFCGFRESVRGVIHEMGLYDRLSLTDGEEEAIEWTRKIVLQNTGSDIEVNHVPLGGGEPLSVGESGSEAPNMDALMTQPMDRDAVEDVIDLPEESIVAEEEVVEEVPAGSEMVTQEIPEDHEQYAEEAPAQPEPFYEPTPEPRPVIYGAITDKSSHRRPILLGMLLIAVVVGLFFGGVFGVDGTDVLGWLGMASDDSSTVATTGTGSVQGNGGDTKPPPDTNGAQSNNSDTTPIKNTDTPPLPAEEESASYEEALHFALTDLLGRP